MGVKSSGRGGALGGVVEPRIFKGQEVLQAVDDAVPVFLHDDPFKDLGGDPVGIDALGGRQLPDVVNVVFGINGA